MDSNNWLKSIQEKNLYYSIQYDHLPVGFCLYEKLTDEQGLPTNYRYLYVNSVFERFVEKSRDKLIGKLITEVELDFGQGNLERDWKPIFDQIQHCQREITFQFYHEKFDRYIESVVYSPEANLVAAVLTDVTEYVRAYRNLRASEANFTQIFDLVPVGVLITTVIEGKVLEINDTALKIFSVQREDALGRTVFDLRMWRDQEERERSIQGGSKRNPAKAELEIGFVNFGGEEVFLELIIESIQYNDQDCFIAVLHDVTLQKKMAIRLNQEMEERRKMEKQIIQSSKLASVGTLAAGIAHEINNPLTIVDGLLSLMERENTFDVGSNISQRLKKIKWAIKRISHIINGLKIYTNEDVGEQEVNVNDVVRETMMFVEEVYCQENIVLKCELDYLEASVIGVKGKIQQVLMSLLNNARDAVTDFTRSPLITIATKTQSNQVQLIVKDNGCGIENKNIEFLFDPFYTTKSPGKGSGLGLSISHSIITHMGGKIEVKSTVGQGTVVTVSIPVTRVDVDNHKKVEPVAEKKRFSGRALIVDDECDILEILKDVLESLGIQVETCDSALGALEKYERQPDEFDYFFTDIRMPGITGDQLLQKIDDLKLNINGKTKFVVMTGGLFGDLSEVQTQVFRNLAQGFIHKPFVESEISELLNRLAKEPTNQTPLKNS